MDKMSHQLHQLHRPIQLPTDCLLKIFEYLEDDKLSLRSCLLVCRLWCVPAASILWRNIWDFRPRSRITLSIFSTLFACLPEESKNLLRENNIIVVSTPT